MFSCGVIFSFLLLVFAGSVGHVMGKCFTLIDHKMGLFSFYLVDLDTFLLMFSWYVDTFL